jgi:predicted  nucleic acid-binding Zn-ribbon protein
MSTTDPTQQALHMATICTSITENKKKQKEIADQLTIVDDRKRKLVSEYEEVGKQIRTEEQHLKDYKESFSPRTDGVHDFNVIIASGGFWHADLPNECLREARNVKRVSL